MQNLSKNGIEVDIPGFPKSPRSSSWDKNWASYGLPKLGNFGKFQEMCIEQIWTFKAMT